MKIRIQKNKYMFLVLLLFLSANFFAAVHIEKLREYADLIVLHYPEETVQISALEQMKGDEDAQEELVCSQAVLWKSTGENTISAEQTGRGRKIPCYHMKGLPGAVFGADLIHGRYFSDDENNTCLLDQNTVRQLFGSEDTLEKEIRINGTGFRIVGILRGKRPICVTSFRSDSEYFDGVAVRKMKAGDSSAVVFSRLEAIFGSTTGQKIDGQLYYVTACLFYAAGLAFLLILAGIVRRKKRYGKWLFTAYLAASCAVLWLGVRFAAPGSDYLPTYWSDFGFFTRLFREKAEQIQALAVHQEFSSWQDILRNWQQAITAGIFMILLSIIEYLPRRENSY